jgi:ABC-type transporter Mla subunit MlaD
MGIADRLKELTKRAKDATAEHKEQIQQAVEKAEVLADQRTGGKYHDQIQKAGAKVETYVENLPSQTEEQNATEPQATPPQAGEPHDEQAGPDRPERQAG